jgi:hypothetical protein
MRAVFAVVGVAIGLSVSGPPAVPVLLVLALVILLYRDHPFGRDQ